MWGKSIRAGLVAAAFVASCGVAAGAPLDIPTLEFPIRVLGLEVLLPVNAAIELRTEDKFIVSGTVVGDLSDLQAKALTIAQSIPFPQEKCPDDDADLTLIVDRIESASIVPDGNAARLTLGGHVTGYGCLFGASAELVSTGISLSATVAIEVLDGKSVRLRLIGDVEPGPGLAGDVIGGLDFVKEAIRNALEKALDGTTVAAEFADLPDLELEIHEATFVGEGDALKVRAGATARMSAETFAKLFDAAMKSERE